MPFSPTANLPNYVFDGTGPHMLDRSPRKSRENSVDWLTQIRQQRLFKERPNVENPTSSSPKTPTTPINRGIKRARSTEPTSASKKKKTSTVSLLKYFEKIPRQKTDSKVPSCLQNPQPTTSRAADQGEM